MQDSPNRKWPKYNKDHFNYMSQHLSRIKHTDILYICICHLSEPLEPLAKETRSNNKNRLCKLTSEKMPENESLRRPNHKFLNNGLFENLGLKDKIFITFCATPTVPLPHPASRSTPSLQKQGYAKWRTFYAPGVHHPHVPDL